MNTLEPQQCTTKDVEATVSNEVRRWHVLRTRPRQEKALARALGAAGIAHDALLVSRRASHGGRQRLVETPLFPGYLMLHGEREETFFALSTRRAIGVITIDDQERFETELRHIQRAIVARATLELYPGLTPGVRVRVTRGPFRGVEGLVESSAASERLFLTVSALGQAVSLEIDPGTLVRV